MALLATDLHIEATYRLTEALADAENKMRRRVEHLSEVVFELDAVGCIVFLNRAWHDAMALDPAACLGHPLSAFVADEDLARFERAAADRTRSGAAVPEPFKMRRADGADCWMRLSLAPIAVSGTVTGAVGTLSNVTLEKAAQDDLAKLSLVASYTDNFVIITDREGRTEWVNDAFVQRTGYTLADLTGKKPGSILQGPMTDPATVRAIGDSLRRGESFSAELVNYTKQHEPYWVSLQATPIVSVAGVVERYVSVQTDSTELRRTQTDLQHAKERAELASTAKTQFLATVSHEMRTPLNAIIGSTDLALDGVILDGDGGGSELREHLVRINESAELLMRLISDMLDISKIEAGQIVVEHLPVEIRACLSSAVAPMAERARKNGLEFVLTMDEALPACIMSDPDRLRQVVVNLVENAVKFTERGFVHVTASRVEEVTSGGRAVEIRVRDSGMGISAELQTRIFERFVQGDSSTTRRHGGAGLGLSIVHSIAGALGGSVSVDSAEGRGADFRVTFPLVGVARAAELSDQEQPAAISTPAGSRFPLARVLVTEDTDASYAVLSAYLRKAGYAVERARNGQEAVAAECNAPPDLILMDVEMPGMDGLEATRIIRAREHAEGRASTPILALTAHAVHEYRGLCLAAGCTGYLAKPVRMDALLAAVAAVLG
jgi:PAS domain S-box-containing protein